MSSKVLNFQYSNMQQKQTFGANKQNIIKKSLKTVKKIAKIEEAVKIKEPEGWKAYLSMQRKDRGHVSSLWFAGQNSASSMDLDFSTGKFVYYV